MMLLRTLTIAISSLSLIAFSNAAKALEYQTCISAQQSPICLIAFEKLQTVKNPITKERYFHNDVNITETKELFLFPLLYVATPDLDGDGTPEIIASIREQSHEEIGQYCVEEEICPHFIIQDRVLPDQKRTTATYKAIGPIFAYSVGASTDEAFDNFKSLRAYYEPSWKDFDVYQYDKENDSYFNMSAGLQ